MEKKKKIFIFSLLLIFAFVTGIVFAVQLYQLEPNYLGFWEKEEKSTHLSIEKVSHIIITRESVKTTIEIKNPTRENIEFTLIIYYKDSKENIIAEYSLTGNIPSRNTAVYSWTISLCVEQWAKTTFSIEADY